MAKMTLKEWKEQGKVFQAELVEQLNTALQTYKELDETMRINLKFDPIFHEWKLILGKVYFEEPSSNTTARGPVEAPTGKRIELEALKKFVGTGSKTQEEIQEHFGTNKRETAQQTRIFNANKQIKKGDKGIITNI
jgi:hypothetical protein